MNDKQLSELVAVDPLAVAEKVTGTSYKEDESVTALGMLLALAHNNAKNKAYDETDDTKLTNEVSRYERILAEEGFTCIYEEPFNGTGYGAQQTARTPEKLALWWHPADGLLLAFDTFGGKDHHVNSAKVYYNWKPNEGEKNYWPALSSHDGFRDGVYAGDHDAREALRFNLRRLRSLGSFINPWVRRQFLWLLHYMDTKDENYSYEVLNEKRLAKLPDAVLVAISPKRASLI